MQQKAGKTHIREQTAPRTNTSFAFTCPSQKNTAGNPKENVLRKSAAGDTSSVFATQSNHQRITSTNSSMAAL